MATFAIKPFETQAAGTVEVNAESAIVVDANTGKILYEKKCRSNVTSCKYDENDDRILSIRSD